ncbi:sugar phosphate nucleotidyltransferase [Litoricolaceae bacterium]|nr:sugar phosphate nucleotidyltransferase [Litorivicinaceae bacterium]
MKNKSYRKGVVLAGGTGSRLWPLTKITSKQLLPVFDKPLIYYPIATLMDFGIRDILLITAVRDLANFKALLGDGSQWGIQITYAEQKVPDGIPRALQIADDFIKSHHCALILGDNLFHADWAALRSSLVQENDDIAHILCSRVNHPSDFGVIEKSEDGAITNIIEKPTSPPSNWAVTGLYFYPPDARKKSFDLKASKRGELEITDLNIRYLEENRLTYHLMDHSNSWFDTGTPDGLLSASTYVQEMQSLKTIMIGSPEIAALNQGWLSRTQLEKFIAKLPQTHYSKMLKSYL